MIKKKLLVFLTLFLTPLALTAQVQRSSNVTGMKVVGNAVAAEFGRWSARVALGNFVTGVNTLTIDQGTLVVPDGMGIMPFQTNIPVMLNDGALTETVTPSSVNCSFGGAVCQFTANFSHAHPYSLTVTSGTAGLQEAIENMKASPLGGFVLVTPDWHGTTGMITAASGTTAVGIMDVRAGALTTYAWNGSAYAASGAGSLGNSVTLVQGSGGNTSTLQIGYDGLANWQLFSDKTGSGTVLPLIVNGNLSIVNNSNAVGNLTITNSGSAALTIQDTMSNILLQENSVGELDLHSTGSTGLSNGLQIFAGTNISDWGLRVASKTGSLQLLLRGDGQLMINALTTTGSAGGKHVVCVDGFGQLYASSASNSCAN